MKDEFKERFNYLMSLSNKDLRKEIENSNWTFILQELRYAGETIEAYENMRKEAIEYVKEFTFEPLLINEDRKLIMYNENLKNFENILNKVGEDNE